MRIFYVGVLDLSHPPPRRPLPDADELAVVAVAAGLLPAPRLAGLGLRGGRLLVVVVAVVLDLERRCW
jgi:hypothetical protein